METPETLKYSQQNLEQKVATTDEFSKERYRQFANYLSKSVKTVLDVGCAEGRGGKELKSILPHLELSGLDCVSERLESLPSCYDHKFLGLTNKIPMADQSYDAIVAGEFLEHLYPADVDPTLCEFQRILTIGGSLLMTTPNPHSLKMRYRKETVYGVAHLTQHFPRTLKKRLMMHGFSHVKIIGSGKATRYFGEWIPYLSASSAESVGGS